MSKLQVNDIVNKDDNGSVGFSRGAVVTGVATATTFDGNLTGGVTGNVVGNVTELQPLLQMQLMPNQVVH